MNRANDEIKTRRKFLKMVSASPLLAGPGFLAGSFSSLLAAGESTDKKFIGWLDSLEQSDGVITSPDQAFDVMDFEPAARKILPPAHFGYLSTGVDDDGTARANREGYSRIQIRARRLVDVENIDMSVNLFGTKWNSPIVLSPVSAQKAFHPEGEVAVARAASAKGHLMMLSTVATASIEDVTAARGSPVWRSEEHTSELQSQSNLVCRLLLEKKKDHTPHTYHHPPCLHWRRRSLLPLPRRQRLRAVPLWASLKLRVHCSCTLHVLTPRLQRAP